MTRQGTGAEAAAGSPGGEAVGPVLVVGTAAWCERLAKRLDADAGWSAESAQSADAALQRLEEAPVEAVVAAYDLPENDGVALVERVRQGRAALPVTLCTERGDPDVATAALAAGVTDYVDATDRAGPELFERLRNGLERSVDRYRRRRQRARRSRLFEALFDDAAEYAWVLDADGRVLRANDAAVELFDGGSEAQRGTAFWNLPWGDGVDERGLRAAVQAIAGVDDAPSRDAEEITVPCRSDAGDGLRELTVERVASGGANGGPNSGSDSGPDRRRDSGPVSGSDSRSNNKSDDRPLAGGVEAILVEGRARGDDGADDRASDGSPSEQREPGTDSQSETARRPFGDPENSSAVREQVFREIVENLETVVWSTPPDRSETTYVNPAYEALWGWPRESLYESGRTHLEAVHPDDVARVQRAFERLPDEEFDEQYRIVRPDGRVRWIRDRGYPIEGEDGVDRIVGIAADVTAQQVREQTLHEEKERFRRLVGEVEDYAIFMLDPEGRVQSWNKGALAIKGYERAEILGEHFSQFYTDEQAQAGHPSHLLAQARSEGRVEDEGWRVRKDGSRFWAWVSITALHDDRGDLRGFTKVVRDLTERREYERRLEESNERLAQFARAASHDLQEPMRMVSTYLQLLETKLDDGALPGDARDHLEFAVDSADRMRSMIQGLLEYSRVEERGERLGPVDLNAVVDDVLEELRPKIRASDADIEVDPLPSVEGDASQLRQVVQNLLDNAITYSGDETPCVEIGAERTGSEWTVSVAGEGIGIDPADQEQIFRVFDRLHTHEEYEGAGVGLALCRQIVKRHGGQIWVDSEPGEGATFSFTLRPAGDVA